MFSIERAFVGGDNGGEERAGETEGGKERAEETHGVN
jgi:hypothetical protein